MTSTTRFSQPTKSWHAHPRLMLRRGDVSLVAFPYTDGSRGKVHPALVVQSDRNNDRLRNTIIAMITGYTKRAGKEPTQLLIDPRTPAGKTSGLLGPSAVKCENLFTVAQDDILRTLGRLTPGQLEKVDTCLRVAVGLQPLGWARSGVDDHLRARDVQDPTTCRSQH